MLVSPHNGGIQQQMLQVEITAQGLQHPLPDASFAPAVVSLEHGVPVAESLRQISPGSSRFRYPQHRIDKQPIVLASPTRIGLPARQVRLDPEPLFVRKFVSPLHIAPP
jgi:hypothetical protein